LSAFSANCVVNFSTKAATLSIGMSTFEGIKE
jgi:hypothetical protein